MYSSDLKVNERETLLKSIFNDHWIVKKSLSFGKLIIRSSWNQFLSKL